MSKSAQIQPGFGPLPGIYPGKFTVYELHDGDKEHKLDPNTSVVRLSCDHDCLVTFPSGSVRLEADWPEYFLVDGASSITISASGGGNFYITEGA